MSEDEDNEPRRQEGARENVSWICLDAGNWAPGMCSGAIGLYGLNINRPDLQTVRNNYMGGKIVYVFECLVPILREIVKHTNGLDHNIGLKWSSIK